MVLPLENIRPSQDTIDLCDVWLLLILFWLNDRRISVIGGNLQSYRATHTPIPVKPVGWRWLSFLFMIRFSVVDEVGDCWSTTWMKMDSLMALKYVIGCVMPSRELIVWSYYRLVGWCKKDITHCWHWIWCHLENWLYEFSWWVSARKT